MLTENCYLTGSLKRRMNLVNTPATAPYAGGALS
jgi:hypothetical protein